MKKLNLICASIAVLFAAGTANAGTAVSTATKIAVENFGGSAASQNTLAVLGAPISYSMSSITAVNSGSTVYFTIRLAGGKFAAAPAATAFTFGGQACIAGAATGTNPNCVVSASTDLSTIKIAVTTGTSYTLGLGAFTWTPAAADIIGVNTTLNSVGGSVTATVGLVTLNPPSIEAVATQATIDAPLASGVLAVGAQAITGAVIATSYTGKIDLTASPAASNYTTAGYAILGGYSFTNGAAASAEIRTGASDYTLANGSSTLPNTGATVVVTPGSGQAFPVGAILTLHSNNTCSALLAGAGNTATITAANAATAKTLVTTAAVASGSAYFVCMTNPTSPNVAAPIQATIAATVTPAATTDLVSSISGAGYNLGYNGSTVDVTTYWPGILETNNTGFKGYLRITNTGSVAAVISAQQFSPANGTLVGSTTALNIAAALPGGTLAAGQTVLLSSAQIDNLIGANPSGFNAGRIRITAPTNGLRVQSFMQSGTGNLVEYMNNPSNTN